ncbi:hypothetical protein HOB10_03985 [Candidatus Parcubacteria bacterium]|jgi:hypothetical protein|nr:hypothetical protein [Candidatus Parcubacteria bacterium]
MRILFSLVKDFFNIALGTWLILVAFELAKPGMVQRFINLEYWLYALVLIYIMYIILRR